MRAREFIGEAKKVGKISKRQQAATRGLHKFRDSAGMDRIYELNKAMAAVASTDGTFIPEINAESWSGRYNTAHPYTEVEQRMLEKAFQSIGTECHDLNSGDMRSTELDSTNVKSPVVGFRGFGSTKKPKKKKSKKSKR